jgi:hypothetical protein
LALHVRIERHRILDEGLPEAAADVQHVRDQADRPGLLEQPQAVIGRLDLLAGLAGVQVEGESQEVHHAPQRQRGLPGRDRDHRAERARPGVAHVRDAVAVIPGHPFGGAGHEPGRARLHERLKVGLLGQGQVASRFGDQGRGTVLDLLGGTQERGVNRALAVWGRKEPGKGQLGQQARSGEPVVALGRGFLREERHR